MRSRTVLVVLSFALACESTPSVTRYDGFYVAPGGVLELHKGHDGPLRGYLRTAEQGRGVVASRDS
jgi:hypothetical protein